MGKVPLHRVITEVLQQAGHPMSPLKIYKQIESKKLYTFNSNNPVGIVRNQFPWFWRP